MDIGGAGAATVGRWQAPVSEATSTATTASPALFAVLDIS
jgi:hypothetical protein